MNGDATREIARPNTDLTDSIVSCPLYWFYQNAPKRAASRGKQINPSLNTAHIKQLFHFLPHCAAINLSRRHTNTHRTNSHSGHRSPSRSDFAISRTSNQTQQVTKSGPDNTVCTRSWDEHRLGKWKHIAILITKTKTSPHTLLFMITSLYGIHFSFKNRKI